MNVDTCYACRREVARDQTFCHHCGTPLRVECARCGQKSPQDSRYCHNCGADLPPREVRPRASDEPEASPYRDIPERISLQAGSSETTLACPRCHAGNDVGAAYCFSCGLPLEGVAPSAEIRASSSGVPLGRPAGFWVRVAALIIDSFLLSMVNLIVLQIVQQEPPDSFRFTPLEGLLYLIDLAYFVVGWSVWGTTLGKRVFGIYVVAGDGGKPSALQSVGRYFARLLSFAILFVGVIMVGFRGDKRGLHDLIAGTCVVYKS